MRSDRQTRILRRGSKTQLRFFSGKDLVASIANLVLILFVPAVLLFTG